MVAAAQPLPVTDLADRSGAHTLVFGEFQSILGPEPDQGEPPARLFPPFFHDLNLDQFVDGVVAGRDEYDLRPFFLAPPQAQAIIAYRHAVFRDLENSDTLDCVKAFAAAMRKVRHCRKTAEKLHYREQQQAWLLEEVEAYCIAVKDLAATLSVADVHSQGFRMLRDYLRRYVGSPEFGRLRSESEAVRQRLQHIEYCMVIDGSAILVRRRAGEPDYAAEVTGTFRDFSHGVAKTYSAKASQFADMNHIEAAILARVKRLFPEPFAELDAYCDRNRGYADRRILAFDREVQFYAAYLDYIAPMRRAGLPFADPSLAANRKRIDVRGTFDIVLARQLAAKGCEVVGNDIQVRGDERILVVSGPNQGGKTTFARMFGQLHYLARLGVPIPGARAELFLCDQIFTHFEKQELGRDLRGKLEDDLLRIRDVLARADGGSIIVLNEIFTSTSLQDAIALSTKVLRRIMALDCLCVCVTFIDELASLGKQTVSVVSSVDPQDSSRRTFKLERRPADGLAYAMTLAEKYALTYQRLLERVPS